MNNGKKRNGKELDSATEESECTCGMCHKYIMMGSLPPSVLEMSFDDKVNMPAPVWTCHDSCMVALLTGCEGYGVE